VSISARPTGEGAACLLSRAVNAKRAYVFYPVDDALRRVDVPLAESPLNAALDGAQDALVALALASSNPSAP